MSAGFVVVLHAGYGDLDSRMKPVRNYRTRHSHVVLALARFHGSRLLRHPIIVVGAFGSVGVFWVATASQAPVLHRDAITLSGSCLVLASLTLVVADFGARRERTGDNREMLDATPTSADSRMLGLAGAGWGSGLASIAVLAAGLLWMYSRAPVGSPAWWELAGAPALVFLAHTLGVNLGRWFQTPIAAPTVIIGLTAWFIFPILSGSTASPSPFFPWLANDSNVPIAYPRMPAIHLAYVVGLAILLLAIIVRHWASVIMAGLVVAGTSFLVAGISLRGSSHLEEWISTQKYVCQEKASMQFCVVAGYEPWIDRWAEVVSGVKRVAPIDRKTLRQGIDTILEFNWNTEGWMARDLAETLVRPALDIPDVDSSGACADRSEGISGQARGVAAEVIAASVTDAAEEDFNREIRRLRALDRLDSPPTEPMELSGAEMQFAQELLELPRDEMLSSLAARWEELENPSTTTSDMASWFDLPSPDVPPHQAWVCDCGEDGSARCSTD